MASKVLVKIAKYVQMSTIDHNTRELRNQMYGYDVHEALHQKI